MTSSLFNGKFSYHLEISKEAHWNLVRLGAALETHNEDYAESVLEAHAEQEGTLDPAADESPVRLVKVNSWGYRDLEDIILLALLKSGHAVITEKTHAIDLAVALSRYLSPTPPADA